MTSSLHREANRSRRLVASTVRRGFTLIEMLVVMGIILLLISLLLPAINRAYQQSVRTSMGADLAVISQALEAYKGEWGDYPRSGNGPAVQGSVILCWALIAPGPQSQDGAGDTLVPTNPGPGFRIRGTGQGKVYGPYLPIDRFQISSTNDTNAVIRDRYDHTILYYPANKSLSPSVAFVGAYPVGTIPPRAMYNYSDNAPGGHLTQNVFEYRLGNHSMTGAIAAGEQAIVTPYVLWSSGPDGAFGPQIDATTGTAIADDDVTYPVLDPFPVGQTP